MQHGDGRTTNGTRQQTNGRALVAPIFDDALSTKAVRTVGQDFNAGRLVQTDWADVGAAAGRLSGWDLVGGRSDPFVVGCLGLKCSDVGDYSRVQLGSGGCGRVPTLDKSSNTDYCDYNNDHKHEYVVVYSFNHRVVFRVVPRVCLVF